MNEPISINQICKILKDTIKITTRMLLLQKPIKLIALLLGIGCAIIPLTALPQDDQAMTWSEFDLEAPALAEKVSFLAAEITDGTCEEVHGLSPELTLPIGSGFKLYILGELAQQIAQNRLLTPLYHIWSFPRLG
jgi:hypothetical protein